MNKHGGRSLAPRTSRSGRSRGDSNTGIPSRRRDRGVGSGGRHPERRGFGNQIQCVKKVGDELTRYGTEGLYREAKVGPALVVRGVPEGLGGGRPPLGLSSLSNSQGHPSASDLKPQTDPDFAVSASRKRHGLNGISRAGRKFVDDFCLLTEQCKRQMAMWTVNLENGWYLQLKETGTWALFQRRLIDRITQHLKAMGNVALVLAVVELSPKRGERTGRPYPHLHYVLSGWGIKKKGVGYILQPQIMDAIVQKALEDVGIRVEQIRAASNIEGIRQSVRSYVRGYLKKQVDLPSVDLSDGWDELIPRQWWNRSAAARALVDGHYFKLPSEFVYFMLCERKALEALKLGIGGISVVGMRKTLTGERPIEIEWLRFFSPAAISRAIELWLLYERDPCGYREEVRACLGVADLDRQNAEHARAFSLAAMESVPDWLDVVKPDSRQTWDK